MVRTLIILLLLAVFFLSGAFYGVNQSSNPLDSNAVVDNDSVELESEPISRPVVDEKVVAQTTSEDVMDMENNVHLTNNAASFLETSVQGFFEIVVGILYQIAEIFF